LKSASTGSSLFNDFLNQALEPTTHRAAPALLAETIVLLSFLADKSPKEPKKVLDRNNVEAYWLVAI